MSDDKFFRPSAAMKAFEERARRLNAGAPTVIPEQHSRYKRGEFPIVQTCVVNPDWRMYSLGQDHELSGWMK